MADQIKMQESVRYYLETEMIGAKIGQMTIRGVLGAGNTAITYDVEDENGLPWALKVVSRESYGEHAPFREIARFARAKDERFLVFPKEVDDWTPTIGGKQLEFVWFKSRKVIGQTLRDFLASNTQFSAMTEVTRFVENLTAALSQLEALGFSHGDWHDGNIMREVIGEDGPLPEVRYVVIDFSEAHPIEATQEGLSKDIENFGSHLRSFSDAIYQREVTTRDDEKILAAITHIPGLLNGTAPESMGVSRPSQIMERFKDGLSSIEEAPRKLDDPFHPLSSEHIVNDSLLSDLCFTEMSWRSELEKNSNVVLIGPRGSGKTMIFRRLRLRTKIASKKDNEIVSDSYVAFYLPCESLFYMRFSDLSEVDIDKNKDALVLYFNMAVLAEICSTLSVLPKTLGPVTRSAVVSLVKLAKDETTTLWKQLNFPSFLGDAHEIVTCAENVMRHIRKSIAYGEEIPARGSTDFITRLVKIVKREVPSLSARTFIFFLDDYTEERVPLALQEALHPIVCQRSPKHCFKISAHMFGSIYTYPRPLALDEGRNIEVLNLGTAYLKRNRKRVEGKLLLKILNARFKHCEGYLGTVEEWLGRTRYPAGRTLSMALHDETTRDRVHYHGIDCLMALCTGDYSEMIRMVGEIFREARIGPGTQPRLIPPTVQDRAITGVSREYLGRIRHIRPDGQKLYEVVYNFGKLSQGLLYERKLVGQGKDSKGNPRKDPYDMLSIFVDDLTKASRSSRQVWERLQRASIFVDVGIAPSQRSVVADRVTIRRIYCPAFRTTHTSSEHLQPTKQQFEYFMDQPEEFCNDQFRKKTNRTDQPSLLDTESVIAGPAEPLVAPTYFPEDSDRVDFLGKSPATWVQTVKSLPVLTPIDEALTNDTQFDLYLAALGFEERTTAASSYLLRKQIRVKEAALFEFDLYYQENQEKQPAYREIVKQLTGGEAHRPINAPVGVQDSAFPARIKDLLRMLNLGQRPRVLFDCTSCPSSIHSQCLSVLLDYDCDLTVLYSEADSYFPTLEEWESSKPKRHGRRVEGPFSGVRFVSKPTMLQADDTAERPVLQVLFPTFNTERTDGVLAEIDPASRVWIFGEPHELSENAYRIEMAKWFASPVMTPGDEWCLVSTLDYKNTLLTLAGIYEEYRITCRFVVMPHGSKMQTLAANLFAAAHQVSMVFAMPKTYDPKRYSTGCRQVWAIRFGSTQELVARLRSGRTLGVDQA